MMSGDVTDIYVEANSLMSHPCSPLRQEALREAIRDGTRCGTEAGVEVGL